MKIKLSNEAMTKKFSENLSQFLQPGDIILLEGSLGAGKTTFTKGLAKGLGVTENVKSPTYTLIREYQSGRLPLYHMDVYRLENSGAEDLGLEEYFEGGGVCVVEWAHLIATELPTEYLQVTLSRDTSDLENGRELSMLAKGIYYEELATKIMTTWQQEEGTSCKKQ